MHLYSALITRLKGALQWSIYPQRTGSIYGRKLQPLLSSPCMLVLILPTSEGWKAEWTLAGKKVAKYSPLGRTGNGTRDLRVGRQRSYHCANPSAKGNALSWIDSNTLLKYAIWTLSRLVRHYNSSGDLTRLKKIMLSKSWVAILPLLFNTV